MWKLIFCIVGSVLQFELWGWVGFGINYNWFDVFCLSVFLFIWTTFDDAFEKQKQKKFK